MENHSLLNIMLILPLLGGLISILFKSYAKILIATCVFTILTFIVAIILSISVFKGSDIFLFNNFLFMDSLSAYNIIIMLLIFSLSSIFSINYFQEEYKSGIISLRKVRRYALLFCFSLFAMLIVLVSNNIGIMWVGIEATTLLTAFLITIHLSMRSLEAMWKYIIICSIGVAFAFIGTIFVGGSAYNLGLDSSQILLWTNLNRSAHLLNPFLMKAAFIFLLVGYGTKAGLAPMHSWLPDAHSQAPAPVSAIFSGFMLNTALYCIMRYIPLVEKSTGNVHFGLNLLLIFGIASIVISTAFIIFQEDLKRLLAYCSVEHIGIITLGLGLGGFGTFVALFHTLNHSLCKSLSFLSAGKLGQSYNTHKMSEIKGALKSSPIWGIGLIGSMFALIGIAPFSIFLSEFQLVKTAIEKRQLLSVVIFLICGSVIFMTLLKRVIHMSFGSSTIPNQNKGFSFLSIIVVFVPLAILLFLGLCIPESLYNIISSAAKIIGD